MREYIIRRLLLVPITLVLVSCVVFSLSRMIPGDVVDLMYQEKEYAKDMEEMRKILGLDKPMHVQYFSWMGNILKGDWGVSLWSAEPVLEEIGRRWPVTLELGLIALIISSLSWAISPSSTGTGFTAMTRLS